MNNNTTKQIDATTQRSTSNLVSTQSARERSVRGNQYTSRQTQSK